MESSLYGQATTICAVPETKFYFYIPLTEEQRKILNLALVYVLIRGNILGAEGINFLL